MKKSNIIIIIAATLIAATALFVALKGSRKATFKQDYHVEDIGAVDKIYLADKENNEVLLTRNEDSTWIVNGTYTASPQMVDLLLETLHTMRIRQQVNRNGIPTIIKDLAARAIKIEVYQTKYAINLFNGKIHLFPHQKLTVTYYVGRETQDMMATYMLRDGDKTPCVIHIPGFRGFLTPRFPTDPLKWRSHLIADLNISQIATVTLQAPSLPDQSWSITHEGDDFLFKVDGKIVDQFDTARVAAMLKSFRNLNFDEFAAIVPNTFADSCVNGEPRAILTISDTNGNTHHIRTYIKYNNPDDILAMPDPTMYNTFDLDRLYAIVSHHKSDALTNTPKDSQDTVLIQYYVFDNILQPAAYFLGADNTISLK